MKFQGYIFESNITKALALVYPSHARTFYTRYGNILEKDHIKIPDLLFIISGYGFYVFEYIEPIIDRFSTVNILKINNVNHYGKCCLANRSYEISFPSLFKNVDCFFQESFNIIDNFQIFDEVFKFWISIPISSVRWLSGIKITPIEVNL